jgi:hypothetical protein
MILYIYMKSMRIHVRAFRDISDDNIAYFQRALQNENWQEVYNQEDTPWPLVRERTIPTERPPLVDEI